MVTVELKHYDVCESVYVIKNGVITQCIVRGFNCEYTEKGEYKKSYTVMDNVDYEMKYDEKDVFGSIKECVKCFEKNVVKFEGNEILPF